jgi:hypothetical protein
MLTTTSTNFLSDLTDNKPGTDFFASCLLEKIHEAEKMSSFKNSNFVADLNNWFT